MKLTSKMAILLAALMLIALPLMVACGDDDDTPSIEPTETPTVTPTETPTVTPTITPTVTPSPTEEPTPPEGPEIVYQVTYEEEVTNWTFNVTGEETLDGVDCWNLTASFDINPFRYANPTGAPTKINGIGYSISKTTLDAKKAMAEVEVIGNVLTSIQSYDHAVADHGQPFTYGDAYAVSQNTELVPPMYDPFTTPIDVEVTAVEDITVPAGTFRCYKVELTTQGNPIDTEWYSAEYDLLLPVKVVRYAQYQAVETRELVSYDPLPAKNSDIPDVTGPKPTETPSATETPEPTETPPATETPEPTETPGVTSPVGTSWSYKVTYVDDVKNENNEATMTEEVTGEENKNGIDCYMIEAAIEGGAKRWYHYPDMMLDVPVKLFTATEYRSLAHRDMITEGFFLNANFMGGIDINVERVYNHDNRPEQLTADSAWTYQTVIDLPTFAFHEEMDWNAEVVATEEITVPAGTFTCYRVDATSGPHTNSFWWDVDGELFTPVKYIYAYVFIGVQTCELESYTPAS